jgi:hypothetical protein
MTQFKVSLKEEYQKVISKLPKSKVKRWMATSEKQPGYEYLILKRPDSDYNLFKCELSHPELILDKGHNQEKFDGAVDLAEKEYGIPAKAWKQEMD